MVEELPECQTLHELRIQWAEKLEGPCFPGAYHTVGETED